MRAPSRSGTALVVAAALMGATAGLGFVTFGYADGLSYVSDDSRACANCHVMREQYDGWQKGPHHAVATCNDCHVPHDFVGHWLSKARNGFHHSKAFTLQNFHEPIRITAYNAERLQASCVHCHAELVEHLLSTRRGADEPVQCVHCHRGVGHGSTE
jgi:cytochrome c nitrite reductase small subunit